MNDYRLLAFKDPALVFGAFVAASVLWYFIGLPLCSGYCVNVYSLQKPYQAALFLPALLVCWAYIGRYRAPMQRFGIAPTGHWKRYFCFGLLVGLSIYLIYHLVLVVQGRTIEWLLFIPFELWTSGWVWLHLLIYILNAIVLEFLFRGLILSMWAEQKTPIFGIGISSVFFGISMSMWTLGMSFSWDQAFVWSSFGLLAGSMAWITRSLWTSIGLHLMFYLLFFYGQFFGIFIADNLPVIFQLWIGMFCLGLAIIILLRPQAFLHLTHQLLKIRPNPNIT